VRRPRPLLTRAARLAAALAAALGAGGCIDFGLEVPAPAARPREAAEVPADCVEEEVDPAEATVEVQFQTLGVDKPLVAIAPGGAIRWVNGSSQIHTATAGAPGADLPLERGGFDSGRMPGGGSAWAYRFCQVRTVLWYCRTHPAQMRDYRIVVGAAGETP